MLVFIFMEIWKDIPEYEGHYQVSNLGEVKSLKYGKEKILSKAINSNGYYCCVLSKNRNTKTRKVHQLVSIAFLGHSPNGHKLVVDHIDNNRLNNRLDNLQLISQRENTSKDKKCTASKYTGVTWDKNASKWMARIRINNKNKYLGLFQKEYDAYIAYKTALNQLT
jgi:hypothetical protein